VICVVVNITINLLLYLGIEVTFEVKSKTLVMGTAIPGTFGGSLAGLLGNFDGISTNDFILPDGNVLENRYNSEKEIYYNYGQHCKYNVVLFFVMFKFKVVIFTSANTYLK